MFIASLVASPVSVISAFGAVVVSLWAVRFPRLALVLLALSLVVGQIGRLPLPGQGGGLLLSDLAVVLVLVSAWFYPRPWPRLAVRAAWWLVPFIVWSGFSLAVNSASLTRPEILLALAYWLRLMSHLLLLPVLLSFSSQKNNRQYMQWLLLSVVGCVALAGLLQLWLVPHLVAIRGGWDPHAWRLVSTWLDPNFIGGFFALLLPWLSWQVWQQRGQRRVAYGAVLVLASLSLALTQSRSSFVALGIGLVLLSPWWIMVRYRRTALSAVPAIALLGLLVSVGMIMVLLLGERAWGLVTYDPTVVLRVEALRGVWQLAAAHSWVGVGYNAYQFAAKDAGLVGDFMIHSRAGADVSWLTLWVTTGIIGVGLFLLPWCWVVQRLLRRAMYYQDAAALVGLCVVATWFVHSNFVNSLLYAHLLIAVAMIVAITWPTKVHDTNHTDFLSASSPVKPPASPLSGGRD